ncbi:MAG: type II secretion system protein [Endomicrobiales bacterium]|nr:type II secretion system protein [Endomicrobiales bacterium]
MTIKNGFTLIEVLVGIAVFSIVMLAGVAFFTLGEKHVVVARAENVAQEVSRAAIETACAEDFSLVVTYTSAIDRLADIGTVFNLNFDVSSGWFPAVEAGQPYPYKRLQAAVDWQSGGETSNMVFTRYLVDSNSFQ